MLKLLKLNLVKYMPSLLNRIEYKPTSIVISLTNRCNCRCIMCAYWELPSQNELTTDEVKNILSQAKNAGIKTCILYGGEPMLREDIFALVAYAHKIGLKTEVFSNGLLIDSQKAQRLVSNGLDRVVLSLDIWSEEQDRIRGVEGAYNKTLSALSAFAGLREQPKFEVMVASILMLPTLKGNNLLKVVEEAEKLRAPVIIQLLDFSPFYFKGVAEKVKKELWIGKEHYVELGILVDKLIKIKKEKPWLIVNSIPALEYIKRYYKDPEAKDTPCYVVFNGRIWVDSQGKLYLCQGLPPQGNLRKEDLKARLLSKKWQEGVRRAFRKQCPGCSCSYALNIDMHIPFAWKDTIMRKLSKVSFSRH